jgi:hypothetical protein
LTLLADGQGELCIVDNHFKLLVGQVRDRDTTDLCRLERFFCECSDLVTEFDDVDFFAAQLTND